jgi:hypothetical protein
MNNTNESGSTSGCCSEEMTPGEMMSHCPMAAKFEATLGNPKLIHGLWTIGFVLLVLGVAIILEPVIIAWLLAIVVILTGIAILMIAHRLSQLKASAAKS